jgi:large subunit ribosomal protein L35
MSTRFTTRRREILLSDRWMRRRVRVRAANRLAPSRGLPPLSAGGTVERAATMAPAAPPPTFPLPSPKASLVLTGSARRNHLMQKTKKSVAKRFKLSARGKLMRRTPGFRHLLSAKTNKQKRRASKDKLVAPGHAAALKRCLPFGL